MVQIADRDEVGQIVITAATLVLDVMQIEPDIPATTGHGAAMAIPREHLLAFPWGHRRGRSLRRRGVERAQKDRIASGQLEYLRGDLDISTAGILPTTFAVRAPFDRDLVGR